MKNLKILSKTLFVLSIFGLGLLILPNIMLNPSGNTDIISDNSKDSDLTIDEPNASGLTITNWANLSKESADWLIYKANNVDGYSWNQSGIFYFNLKQGAAGIGMSFIELYKTTKDIDYLNAAKQVGTYLHVKGSTLDTPGQWTEGDSFLLQNYTGLERGSAGVGKFLYELYSLTGNETIKNRANEVFTYIDSIGVDQGNGTEFPWKESYDISVFSGHKIPTKVNDLYGSTTDPLSYLETIVGDDYQMTSESTAITEKNWYNPLNSYSYKIGSQTSYTSECTRLSQQFRTEVYPIDMGTNGIDIMLRRDNSMSGTEALRVGIFKSLQNGFPDYTVQIGGYSDSVPYTSIPTTNTMINFDWSSSAPILDGNSRYGYCIVIESQGTIGPNFFFYAVTTSNSAYSKGRISIYEGSWQTSSITRDLVFNLTSTVGNYITFDFSLNLTDFGIPANIFNPNYLEILNYYGDAWHDTAGIDVGFVSIYDVVNDAYERLGAFDDTMDSFDVWLSGDNSIYLQGTQRTVKFRFTSGDLSQSHSVFTRFLHYRIKYNDADYSFDRDTGAAGIGDYLLDLYELSNNKTYFNLAQRIGNFLINNASVTNVSTTYYAAWNFGSNGYATSISTGVAGVGSYLLRLSLLNKTNTQYAEYARYSGNWLVLNAKTSSVYDHLNKYIGIGAYWTQTNSTSSTSVYNGLNTGIAGIGKFLLELGLSQSVESTANTYLTYANYAGNYLISSYNNLGAFTSAKQNLYTYSWAELARSSGASPDLSLESGTAGVIQFLDQLYHVSHNTNFSKCVSGGLEYFASTSVTDVTGKFWNLTGTNSYTFSLFKGVAGIALSLLGIDFNSYDAIMSAEKAINWLYTQRRDLPANMDEYPQIMGSNIYYNGLANGTAGVGLAFLNMYRATGNNTYFTWASYCARRLQSYSAWNVSSKDGSFQYGIAGGAAGMGLFLIEMVKSSSQSMYLTTLNKIAYHIIKAKLPNNSWPNSTSDSTVYFGYDYGTAGIMFFFTEMYKLTQNSSYLNYAEAAAQWLDSNDVSGIWNLETLSSTEYYGFSFGAAGIAYSLLNLYDVTHNVTYLNLVDSTYQALDSKVSSQSIQASESDLDKYSSIEHGQAGILKFLSEYYDVNKSTTVQNTIISLNSWLESEQQQTGNGNFYLSANVDISYKSYRRGIAGVVSGLIKSYSANLDDELLDVIDDAKNYIITNQGILGYWNDSYDTNVYLSYYNGISGIIDQLLQIPDLKGPSLSALDINITDLNDIQYFNSLKIDVVSEDIGSGLNDVVLVYRINSGSWIEVSFEDLGSDLFSTVINAQDYNSNVDFYVVSIDQSGLLTIDDNDRNLYSYTSQDNIAPQIISLYTSDSSNNLVPIQYATGGKILVKIDEPTLASGISLVRITYDNLDYLDLPQTLNMQFVTGSDNIYEVVIPGTNYVYNDDIQYNLTIQDQAGNSNITQIYYTKVGDSISPNIDYDNVLLPQTPEIPTLTSVFVMVPAYDDLVNIGESGISSVYINYTIDNGNSWSVALLTYDAFEDMYSGSIPGQTWFGVDVRYMICVADNAGNKAFYDSQGNKYSAAQNIPINFLFRYSIVINWVITIIIVAIIAAISVFIYYMVARRGDYWSRMRRQADGAATAISIQEKLTNVYYSIMGRLNAFGTLLTKKFSHVPGEPHKVKDWFEEHMSDAMKALLTRIKLAIKASIKGIGLVIISPLYLIVWLVKKTGGMQAMMTVLISLLMIIFPVIKYVTEPPYPQAALFFINLGFILFISSFLLLIFHLIYRIAYK